MRMLSHQIEALNKYTELIKIIKKEISELKSIITKMKNSLEELKSRFASRRRNQWT